MQNEHLDKFDAGQWDILEEEQGLVKGYIVSTTNSSVFFHINGHDDLIYDIRLTVVWVDQ